MKRALSTRFEEELRNKFNIIDIIDLFAYDSNLEALKDKLHSIKKEEFSPNDRIVFMHFDTEYYLYHNEPGLPDKTTPDFVFSVFHQLIFHQLIFKDPDISITEIDLNVDLISHKFSALNGNQRYHRTALCCLLKADHLFNYGIVSYQKTT